MYTTGQYNFQQVKYTKSIVICMFFLFWGCSSPKTNNESSSELKNSAEISKIDRIRGDDDMGFDANKNKEIYKALNYPNEGYKDTVNGLVFELIVKKDTSGIYDKGICWFVQIHNFSDVDQNWQTIQNWSDKFDYDMTALNEMYFIKDSLGVDPQWSRTKLIMSFFDDEYSQSNIIASREVNEDQNTFERYPFRE